MDNVNMRVYQGVWGVMVSVPTLGDEPHVNVFNITPPNPNKLRVGDWDVTIEFLPDDKEPIVTVEYSPGAGVSSVVGKGKGKGKGDETVI